MRRNTSPKFVDTPLIEALRRVEYRLANGDALPIIVAARTLKQLKERKLPENVRVTAKKLHGPRQPIRGRRYYNQQQLKQARWPNDGMDENVLPFILCVLSGQADFRIADYVLHCSVGNWIFVPSGIPKPDGNDPHLEGNCAGRQNDVLWIYTGSAREGGISCWICRSKENQHIKLKNANCHIGKPFVAQLFNGFCDEIQSHNPPQIPIHLLRGVLLMMRAEIESNNALIGGVKQALNFERPLDPIEEAQLYIKTNIYRQLTIQHVARQVLVSPSTLTRRFRERTGQTFHEFLNVERVKLASELLRETNLPISLISKKVGLKYGQLRVLIQREYQCSPGELRARKIGD